MTDHQKTSIDWVNSINRDSLIKHMLQEKARDCIWTINILFLEHNINLPFGVFFLDIGFMWDYWKPFNEIFSYIAEQHQVSKADLREHTIISYETELREIKSILSSITKEEEITWKRTIVKENTKQILNQA